MVAKCQYTFLSFVFHTGATPVKFLQSSLINFLQHFFKMLINILLKKIQFHYDILLLDLSHS